MEIMYYGRFALELPFQKATYTISFPSVESSGGRPRDSGVATWSYGVLELFIVLSS